MFVYYIYMKGVLCEGMYMAVNDKSLLQSIVSFIGLVCRRDI